MALTPASLFALPLDYQVTAPEIAALSGQNRIKGIHPLLAEEPKSVVILTTHHGGDYPDRWLDSDHNDLIYCLEGRFDQVTNKKRYNMNIKSNKAIADGYPVHVFWREKKGPPFRYAGQYRFVDYNTSNPDHLAFHLRRISQPLTPVEPVPDVVKPIIKRLHERDLERAIDALSPQEFTDWMDTVDGSGSIGIKQGMVKTRQINQSVIRELKQQYHGQCQLCGYSTGAEFGVDITEAHHINYFSVSLDNRPSNIAILCPNHHSLVHATKATFDRNAKEFVCEGGIRLPLLINLHL